MGQTMINLDAPKTLASNAERDARRLLLSEAHVQPLTELVNRIRAAKGSEYRIPYFDPLDGGINARVLFLLEAPGRKTADSGFVSRNNPDETAKNFFLLNAEAGIDRRATTVWNAVPWYIGSGERIRPALKRDVTAAAPWLDELVGMMLQLEFVVFVGKKPLYAEPLVRKARPDLVCFSMPHPSPLFVNRLPANRQRILRVLKVLSPCLE